VTLAILILLGRRGRSATCWSTCSRTPTRGSRAGLHRLPAARHRRKAGIPALITRLHPDLHVRSCAAQALMKIVPAGVARSSRPEGARSEGAPSRRRKSSGLRQRSEVASVELRTPRRTRTPGSNKPRPTRSRVEMEGGDAGRQQGTTFIESPTRSHRRVVANKWVQGRPLRPLGDLLGGARAKPASSPRT